MPPDNVQVEVDGAIARIRLDRPEKLNALTLDMLASLSRAAAEIAASDARVVILSGSGRAFTSGFDVETFASGPLFHADPDKRYDAATLGRTAADAIEALPQVAIAAMHGHVVGGGVVLAAACDLRVAERSTRFSIPEVDVGIPLAWGGIARLVREIGPARTKDLVMTGRTFDAKEAYEAGLVTSLVDDGEAVDEAERLAGVIAAKARFPITITKRSVAEVIVGDTSRDDALGLLAAIEDPESGRRRADYLREFGVDRGT
jgi:enoyl-CoA hydratase/carnithine racemase